MSWSNFTRNFYLKASPQEFGVVRRAQPSPDLLMPQPTILAYCKTLNNTIISKIRRPNIETLSHGKYLMAAEQIEFII